ncbi:SRPBCC family protein [Janthinobacterium sp. Ant5-2-1]|uniref:SRPBCC family protein n=1 Tax=Janthinobacterium sp. Ant5-2-1 TaxID=1755239 RepID=UPI000718111A|nr:SRPBCC family protein [Janthinobacterium sp. Ant5-2-1]
MAHTTTSIDIAATPAQVWQLIGGFNSLPDWLPYIPSSTLSDGGRIRHLANPAGDVIVEQLEAYDNAARSYSYSILQAPFPVTDYLSNLQVSAIPGSDGARVTWSGRFTPVGVGEQEVTDLFHGIYVAGLEALQQSLSK